MAAKTQKAVAKLDHVVVAITHHGLDRTVSLFGPFTKAHAHVFATHKQKFENDQCMVEQLLQPCEHNEWIFEGVS